MYLENINEPQDLKQLSYEQLYELSSELRAALLYKLSIKGGHNGPNLGVVELTVALHYVFNSPKDKLVFDVSHQTYIHKMLTGRKNAFIDEDKFQDVTGYTDPNESEHDFFIIGHTSTSISLGDGLAKARDLKGDHENIVAIIGDGSLSGGEALEGLNNVGELDSNMIIIINDNDQSIAENHGGLYKNLRELRKTKGQAQTNLFTAMGLDYRYVEDGHNIENLINVFKEEKDRDKPIVIHIHTIKGKGYLPAEKNREKFHAGGPIDFDKGEYKNQTRDTYNNKTAEFLLDKMKKDNKVIALTAGTPTVLGFTKERRIEAGKQFIDVGIAEEHAVAMISGLAKNEAKPVFGVSATFLQRAYDQILHDLCINSNPATILVFGAGLKLFNDVSHLSLFDITMISNIPGLVYLAPTNLNEYLEMLNWSLDQSDYPVAIRVPVGKLVEEDISKQNYSNLNKSLITNSGEKVAILGLGEMHSLATEVEKILKEKGINPTIINPVYISGIDEDLLNSLKENHSLIITLEDGQLEGGYGSKVAMYLSDSNIKVKSFGIEKGFIDRYDVQEEYMKNGLTADQINQYILEHLN